MSEFLKTTNWQTKVCGGLAFLCAIYGAYNENARSLCEVFGMGVLAFGQMLGVSTGRFKNVVDVIDRYVLLYKQHPIDEVLKEVQSPVAIPPKGA